MTADPAVSSAFRPRRVDILRFPESAEATFVKRAYEDRFGHDPADRGGWFHPADWRRASAVLSRLAGGDRFLDVGVGAAQFTNMVARSARFDEVVAVDRSRFRKYLELDEIHRIDSSITDLDFADGHFDAVTCLEVLEHLDDETFTAGLSELRRVCGGHLIITVPFDEPPPMSRGHLRRFTGDDLVDLFPDATFTILDRPKKPWIMIEERSGGSSTRTPGIGPALSWDVGNGSRAGSSVATVSPLCESAPSTATGSATATGPATDTATESSSEPDLAGAPVLDPLWKRIVTGRSFGWRIRRVRNRVRWARRRFARRTLRYIELHPDLRRALSDGDLVGALHSVRRREKVTLVERADREPVIRARIPAGVPGEADLVRLFPRVVDVVGPPAPAAATPTSIRRISPDTILVRGAEGVFESFAPVDVERWNPLGFETVRASATARLKDLIELPDGPRLDDRMSSARNARRVTCGPTDLTPRVQAYRMCQLSAQGTLLSGSVPDDVAEYLGPSLVDAIRQKYDTADLRERQLHSVRVRREACRLHGSAEGVARLGRELGFDADTRTSVSVLLPSTRPDAVLGACAMVGAQLEVDVELIVGLHGSHMRRGLDERLREAYAGPLEIRHFPDEANLGDVMNGLTEMATAPIVTKWDDDDWYDEHHVADCVRALDYSGAQLVGKGAEFVYLESLDVTLRRFATGAERFSNTLAGGTLAARTEDIRRVGWASVPRQVDRHLIEAMVAQGMQCYRLHGFGHVLRRSLDGERHTWKVNDVYFLRQATDQRPGLDLEFAGFEQNL